MVTNRVRRKQIYCLVISTITLLVTIILFITGRRGQLMGIMHITSSIFILLYWVIKEGNRSTREDEGGEFSNKNMKES